MDVCIQKENNNSSQYLLNPFSTAGTVKGLSIYYLIE